MYCDYDDSPEFFRDSWRTARKQHTCCEHNGDINPGDKYRFVAGKWDGKIFTFKQCERCADLFESFTDMGYCPTFGWLCHDYQEWLDECGIDKSASAILGVVNASH